MVFPTFGQPGSHYLIRERVLPRRIRHCHPRCFLPRSFTVFMSTTFFPSALELRVFFSSCLVSGALSSALAPIPYSLRVSCREPSLVRFPTWTRSRSTLSILCLSLSFSSRWMSRASA